MLGPKVPGKFDSGVELRVALRAGEGRAGLEGGGGGGFGEFDQLSLVVDPGEVGLHTPRIGLLQWAQGATEALLLMKLPLLLLLKRQWLLLLFLLDQQWLLQLQRLLSLLLLLSLL